MGKHFAKHRIEAERVDATTGQGVTNHIHLCPGYHFSIADHGDAKANISHFLLSVSHSGQQPTALQEDAPASEPTTYEAQFTTMPGRLPYRPPVPAKPVMDGSQIGIVVGPEGEEIYTDEMGRVRIWLPWDRHAERRQSDGQRGEHSSCWMRVSQNWAGGNWGSIAIPRIGQEVVVQYFDSDADQPYISGRMYHEANRPPYKLPEHKTRMTIKSQTHKGEGFNELRFEDEAGREEIFVHAQKDRNEKTLNNHSERIDNNWVQSVGHNKAIEVERNHEEIIGGDFKLFVGPQNLGAFVSRQLSKVSEGLSEVAKSVGLDRVLSPSRGNYFLGVEKIKAEAIGLTSSEMIGLHKNITCGKDFNVIAGGQTTLASDEDLMLTSSKEIHLHSESKVDVRANNTRVTIKGNGDVNIKAINVNFEAAGDFVVNAGGEVVMNGKKISLN